MRKIQIDHVHCVLDPECAPRRLFEAISGKWSPLVVMALKDGGKKPPQAPGPGSVPAGRSKAYNLSGKGGKEVGAERMYIFTYGSNQGNSHVHWHVVPLPPGVPYEDQQGAWTSWSKGLLEIPQREMASLAACIGRRVKGKT